MTAPFSVEQFLAVFAAYNNTIWPMQIVAYVLGAIAVAALFLASPLSSKIVILVLVSMWVQNAIVYHLMFFSTINPAANLFAAFFMLQAMLLVGSLMTADGVSFRLRIDLRSCAGLAFIIYALLIYPLLGIWAGHGLMLGPMFGVAPCPTTIFTIGLLMLASGTWVAWLSIIPVLWSLVGLAATLQLGILEDFALPVAGLVLVFVLLTGAGRGDHHRATT